MGPQWLDGNLLLVHVCSFTLVPCLVCHRRECLLACNQPATGWKPVSCIHTDAILYITRQECLHECNLPMVSWKPVNCTCVFTPVPYLVSPGLQACICWRLAGNPLIILFCSLLCHSATCHQARVPASTWSTGSWRPVPALNTERLATD